MDITLRTAVYSLLTIATLLVFGSWLAPLLPPWAAALEPSVPRISASLAQVPEVVDSAPPPDYQREHFGSWAPRGACTTRDLVIAAQAGGTACADYSTATFDDPYTGSPVAATDVDVDHIFPLSAAWTAGAYAWPRQRMLEFSNDPLNLVAVESSVNREKSNQLPSQWLPPDRRARCWYVTRLAAVAAKYQLPLSRNERHTMLMQCPLRW